MPHLFRTPRPVVLALGLLFPVLLTGCSANPAGQAASPAAVAMHTGNWQISSSDAPAARLATLSGELSSDAGNLTGILHTQGATACVAAGSSFEVSGTENADSVVTLSGALAGGTLTVTGTLAADGKSLTDATYTVKGGTCAFLKPAAAKAQSYTPIAGTYTGTFTGSSGPGLAVSATLQQSPASDTSGNYTLSGTGNFGTTPCFATPVTVAGTQVTGGTFTMTYPDSTTGSSATVTGTFSPDATTLTVNWSLTGPCGPDSGTGVLTRQ